MDQPEVNHCPGDVKDIEPFLSSHEETLGECTEIPLIHPRRLTNTRELKKLEWPRCHLR